MTLLDPQPRPLDDPAGCTDAELIAAVRAGDRAAFAQLYERHERAARRMARQLSASPHDVDDLVAEAFARVLDMLSAGRGPDSAFRAYLLTAVRNGMYERGRRSRRLELSDDMGRHDRGEPWQHVRERNHAPGREIRFPFDRVEADRVGQRQSAAARPAERDQVTADAEPLTKVVRQRSNVEAGGTLHSKRHRVAIGAGDGDGVRGDADRVR